MSQEQPPVRSRRELRKARTERPEATPGTGTPEPGTPEPGTPEPGEVNPAPGLPAGAAGGTGAVPAGVDPGAPSEAEVTGRRRIPGPVDAIRSTAGPERSPQVRARDRATLRAIREMAEKEVNLAGGGPLTRRKLRLLQLAAEAAQPPTANPPASAPARTRATAVVPRPGKGTAALPGGEPAPAASGTKVPVGTGASGVKAPVAMTVEQALAARSLLAEQARNQLAKMEHISAADPQTSDPHTSDPNASGPDTLAEQDSVPEPVRNDPATVHNLAMVTPLEFIQVPGVERPVMQRPATSHIPIVTPAGRGEARRKSGNRRQGLFRHRGEGNRAGRAGVLATAEPATQSEDDFTGRAPVAANAAYGLDPLDASTAGLGLARRLRLVQLAVLALGLVALVVGITLILAGLSG